MIRRLQGMNLYNLVYIIQQFGFAIIKNITFIVSTLTKYPHHELYNFVVVVSD